MERTGEALVITDHGKPVLKIVPYSQDAPRGRQRSELPVSRAATGRTLPTLTNEEEVAGGCQGSPWLVVSREEHLQL